MSTETRAEIEAEVKRLTTAAYQRVKNLLEKHIDELHDLAKALLERETLSGKQINEIIKSKKIT